MTTDRQISSGDKDDSSKFAIEKGFTTSNSFFPPNINTKIGIKS